MLYGTDPMNLVFLWIFEGDEGNYFKSKVFEGYKEYV